MKLSQSLRSLHASLHNFLLNLVRSGRFAPDLGLVYYFFSGTTVMISIKVGARLFICFLNELTMVTP